MRLAVSRYVVLVRLGGLEGGGTPEELVGPFGLVRSLRDGVVGLGLLRIICHDTASDCA